MPMQNLFFRLTKIDLEKRLVTGIATAELVDKSGEICDYESTKPYFEKWSKNAEKASGGKSLGNLRSMHTNIAAGKLTQIFFDDVAKAIEIEAKVVDDAEWAKVAEGVYTGFSQGGQYVKKWKDPDNAKVTRYTADPAEVSLVDNPCLGEATFEIVKADGSVEVKKFHVPTEPEQVWLCKDGTTRATKREAVKANAEIEADEIAAAATKGAQTIIDGLNKTLDEKNPDAKPEPKEEKPTDDKPADDKPSEEKKVAPRQFGKSLYDVGRCAEMLECLAWMSESLACESMWEGDNSPQPARLMEIVKELSEFLVALVQEETAELVADKAAADTMEKAEKLPETMANALSKHVKGALLDALSKAGARHSKTDAEHLSKMSAMHDKMGKCMGKMADCHEEMGKCMKGLGMGDDAPADKTVEPDALQKSEARADALQKALGGLTDQLSQLQKRLETVEAQPAAKPGKLVAIEKNHGHEVQTPGSKPDEAAPPKPFIINGLSPEAARQM